MIDSLPDGYLSFLISHLSFIIQIEILYPPIKPFNRISCFIQKKGYIFVARKKEKLVITFKTRKDYDTYY